LHGNGGEIMEDLFRKFKEESMTKEEKLTFLDELYWVDWDELEKVISLESVFAFLESEDLSIEEVSLVLKLYNNPGGDYVKEFSNIIANIYLRDKVEFIRALNLEKDEISNLVYLFRNDRIFENENDELKEILSKGILVEEEEDTAKRFFKTYETVCST